MNFLIQILFFEKDGSNFEQLMKKYGFHDTDVQRLTKRFEIAVLLWTFDIVTFLANF